MKGTVGRRLGDLMEGSVWLLAGVVILFLLVRSTLVTSFQDGAEVTHFLPDSPARHVASILFVLGAFTLWIRHRERIKASRWGGSISTRSVVLLSLVSSAVWVLVSQLQPRADQAICFSVAEAILGRDFGAFHGDGYLVFHPHQAGIVLYFLLVQAVFGIGNVLAVQALNLVALGACYWAVHDLTSRIWKDGRAAGAATVLVALFVPLSLYVTFVYGTIPGFACALLALAAECRFLETRALSDAVLAGVLVSLAILLKPNGLIFLAAMLILLLVDALREKQWRSVGAALLLVLCLLASRQLQRFGISRLVDREASQFGAGVPSLAYLQIGLTRGPVGPGWYSDYAGVLFIESGFDPARARERAKADLQRSIRDLADSPGRAIEFFREKVESQWLSPTFQGLWIQANRSSAVRRSTLFESTVKAGGKLNRALTAGLDLAQSALFFGAFWYVLTQRASSLHAFRSCGLLVFLGGFLFHLVWEAKAQYTLVYFVLLIPYSAVGYFDLAGRVLRGLEARQARAAR